jgi:sugar phosphate permease
MTVSGILWFVLHDKMVDKNKIVVTAIETEKGSVPKKTNKSVVKILILFGIFAVVVNLIKDGLNTWVPKILYDSYDLSQSLSIVLTLVLPILTVFGTTFVVTLNKKIKDYTALMAVVFSLATLLMGVIMIFIKTIFWAVVLISFGLTMLLMSGGNNIVTSILPLSLREKANSGFVAGILNGCCYVGSTISSLALGIISDTFGSWDPVFLMFFIFSLLIVVVSLVVFVLNRIKAKTTADSESQS